MKKGVIYARCATTEENKSSSIGSQLKELRNGGIAEAKKIQTPLGYKKCRTRIIPEKKIALLVKKAFELYAGGGRSLKEIQGLFKKKGLLITTSSIKRMLSNLFYSGKIKTEKKAFQGLCKPLITRGVFDVVQKKLHRKIV